MHFISPLHRPSLEVGGFMAQRWLWLWMMLEVEQDLSTMVTVFFLQGCMKVRHHSIIIPVHSCLNAVLAVFSPHRCHDVKRVRRHAECMLSVPLSVSTSAKPSLAAFARRSAAPRWSDASMLCTRRRRGLFTTSAAHTDPEPSSCSGALLTPQSCESDRRISVS